MNAAGVDVGLPTADRFRKQCSAGYSTTVSRMDPQGRAMKEQHHSLKLFLEPITSGSLNGKDHHPEDAMLKGESPY